MVDLKNNTKVFNDNLVDLFVVLDPKASKFVDIYFKYVNISSDVGLVFESWEYESAVSYDYYKEQIQTSKTDNLVIQFYVNSSRNYIYYTRIYTKFQEFAALIGGLLKIMTFIGSIVTSYFTKYEMLEKMFNSFFDFKSYEENFNHKEGSKKNISIHENVSNIPIIIKPISKNDFVSEIDRQKSNTKENKHIMYLLSKKFNSNKKEQTEIKLNTCQMVKMFLCYCQKKENLKWKLVKIASQKLTKYLDYLKLSKILIEFNRVKKILFTKHQRKLLTIWSKPNIVAKDKNKNVESDEEKCLSLFLNYCAVRENKNDKINENLLHYMDQDYKKVFEDVLENKI